MNLHKLTQFFGWCTVINVAFLIFSSVTLVTFKTMIIKYHSKIVGVSVQELPALYFSFLANYKIATLVFCLTPYIALKVMSS